MTLSAQRLQQNRMAHRSHSHGKNWRQIVIDCGGMCIYRNGSTEPCGAVDYLEFHEPFGEDHVGLGRMQSRVLVCFKHHCEIHDMDYALESGHCRKTGNNLLSDVSAEMEACGGYVAWVKKYNLVDRFGIYAL